MIHHRRLLLGLSAFGLLSPWWSPSLVEISGHNMMIQPEMWTALGLCLVFALAAARVIPALLMDAIERAAFRVHAALGIWAWLGLLAVLLSLYAVNRLILHSFMNSADEHSCLFLADCLRLGRFWVSPHPLSEFFDVVHVGNKAGKWFSVYPPGWPLLLAGGLQFGLQDWVNPVVTTLSLIFLFDAARKLYGSKTALLGIFLCVLTPFFIFTGASYFSHGTALLAISVFLSAFFRWRDASTEKNRVLWAAAASLAMGYGLATRYLTMAAIAGPFLLYHFAPLILKRKPWKSSDSVFVAVLSVFILLILAHNWAITGKPFKAPNKFDKSWERLGFRDDYTPWDGILFFLARHFYLMDWIPPVFVFAYYFFLVRPQKVLTRLFEGGYLFLAAAYLFYYSWGGNQYGPRYYYEGLPFLVFAIARGVSEDWRLSLLSRKFWAVLLTLSLVVAVWQFKKQAAYFEVVSRERKALYGLAEQTLQEPSIVFIRGFLGDKLVMAQEDAVRNHPAFQNKIIYAHDRGGDNKRLMNFYPDRVYFRGFYDRAAKQAVLEKIEA